MLLKVALRSDCDNQRVVDLDTVAADDRFTWVMVIEVFDALERHGYRKASDAAGGRAVGVLLNLIETYEGRA